MTIFHGGCVTCESQIIYGQSRCNGCQYFGANWDLPDLSYRDGDPFYNFVAPSSTFDFYTYQMFLDVARPEELEGDYCSFDTYDKLGVTPE
jgi:hypothetical protein